MKRYQRRRDARAGTGQQEVPQEVPKERQETHQSRRDAEKKAGTRAQPRAKQRQSKKKYLSKREKSLEHVCLWGVCGPWRNLIRAFQKREAEKEKKKTHTVHPLLWYPLSHQRDEAWRAGRKLGIGKGRRGKREGFAEGNRIFPECLSSLFLNTGVKN